MKRKITKKDEIEYSCVEQSTGVNEELKKGKVENTEILPVHSRSNGKTFQKTNKEGVEEKKKKEEEEKKKKKKKKKGS
ncbi:hypothetical protein M8J77_016637 [Diaphorina citri]|nr:hypothetical protein M8J77_016637 [Diaphorina citri]